MGLVVADFQRSQALYQSTLAPLGIQCTEHEKDWAIFTQEPGQPFL